MATVHFVHFTARAQQEPCAPGLPFIAFLQTFHHTYFLSQAANPSLFRGQPGQITSPETRLCRWRSTALYCFAFPSLHGVLIIVGRGRGHRGNVVGPIALNLDHEPSLITYSTSPSPLLPPPECTWTRNQEPLIIYGQGTDPSILA